MGNFEEFKASFGSLDDYLNKGYLNAGRPIPSNIPQLDQLLTGGFRSGLHILGGEPAAGKSALGLYIAMLTALSGTNVLYCSLEMSRYQCIERCASFWSLQTGMPFSSGNAWEHALKAREADKEARRQGKVEEYANYALEHDPVVVAAKRFDQECKSLAIADSEELHELKGIERTAAKGVQAGLELLIVDYLQYVSVDGVADEYTRVTKVSKHLNRLGVSLGIPVIALASCSRSNNGSKPNMHVFKGSGDIEYNALDCMLLTKDPDAPSTRQLHVVKNRNGGETTPDDCLYFGFDGAHNSFEPL